MRWSKFKIFKKYRDEVWGNFVQKPGYNYTKYLVLLNYKKYLSSFSPLARFRGSRYNFLFFLRNLRLRSRVILRCKKFMNFLFRYSFFNNSSVLYSDAFLLQPVSDLGVILPKDCFILNFNMNFFSIVIGFNKAVLIYCDSSFSNFDILCKFRFVFNRCQSPGCNVRNYLKVNQRLYRLKRLLGMTKQRLKTFHYNIQVAAPKKKESRRTLYTYKLMYFRKLCLFFGFSQIKKLFLYHNMIVPLKKNFESLFFLLLECKLDNFFMRVGFFSSVYFLKKFILYGNVFVNSVIVKDPSFLLKPGDLVVVSNFFFKDLYFGFKLKLVDGLVLLNCPKYIEVDYKLFAAVILRKPLLVEVTKPASFDLYTNFLNVAR